MCHNSVGTTMSYLDWRNEGGGLVGFTRFGQYQKQRIFIQKTFYFVLLSPQSNLLKGIDNKSVREFQLKVRKFQNEFMKSSFLPNYEQKMSLQGRNPDLVHTLGELMSS